MVNEFSFLSTGYSTYGREVLTRLHQSNKYEVAEFATYIDHNDPRVANIPWTVYCNMPVTDEEKARYGSSPTNAFGEWRFEDVCLNFQPDIVFDIRDFWMCLTGDTNIVCQSGIKKIKDIDIGDVVLTHKGRYREVVYKFKRNYLGNLQIVNTSHCPFDVTLTDGHPVLTLKRNNLKPLPKFNKSKLEWVDAEKLEEGDILVYPIDNEGYNNWDEDFCRLLGYYMAEGCIMYKGLKKLNILKGVQFTFNSNETNFIQDLQACIWKKYKLKIKTKIIGNTAIVRCYGNDIATDMRNICGELSGNKRMRSDLFFTNNSCITSFLCGLFRGDGGHYENRASYCTKSEQLAHQVFRLCLRLGILPSFNKNNNKCNDKTFYRYIFNFSKKAYDGFVKIYNNQQPSQKSKRILDGYAWLTIKDICKYTKEEEVYNFEVKEDNTYVSSFSIHNCEFESRSPYRPCFNWAIMPTVDAYPQNEQWLSTYCSADAVLTYQDWSGKVLMDETGGKIDWRGSASPASADCFVPMGNKEEIKKALGLDPNRNVVGTVMRNQRRKLYPELFTAFRKYLDKTGDDTILYCHTSYPDRGWDIPYHLMKNGLSSNVFFTYVCGGCGFSFASPFQDAKIQCRNCGSVECGLANVKRGVTPERLAVIMNAFDLYVQYANCEGFGIPQVEAAACGVPVAATDYSAMSDVVRKLNGYPIDVKLLYCEMETGCNRAYPDDDKFIEILTDFFSMPTPMRQAKGMETRGCYANNYSWDKTADKWMEVFDSFEVENLWRKPARLFTPAQPTEQIINNTSNAEYAKWLIVNVLCEPDRLNSYMHTRLVRDLNYEAYLEGTAGLYFNEQSFVFNQGQYAPFNREVAYNQMANLCNRRNHWELKRQQLLGV